MSVTKKSILVILAVLIAGAAAVGYYMYNKGPVNVSDSKGIRINADDLYKTYLQDTAAADKKYGSKILEVQGNIHEVKTNSEGQQVITFKTSTEGGFINCTMENQENNLAAGNTLLIKGVCGGMGQGDTDLGIPGDVYLTRSIVSK